MKTTRLYLFKDTLIIAVLYCSNNQRILKY